MTRDEAKLFLRRMIEESRRAYANGDTRLLEEAVYAVYLKTYIRIFHMSHLTRLMEEWLLKVIGGHEEYVEAADTLRLELFKRRLTQ